MRNSLRFVPSPRLRSLFGGSMVALLIGLILAGCGEDSGNEAAGPNGLGEPGPAPSQADVMACDDAASAYAGLCTNDGNRTCQMAAYQSYCATAANPRAAACAPTALPTAVGPLPTRPMQPNAWKWLWPARRRTPSRSCRLACPPTAMSSASSRHLFASSPLRPHECRTAAGGPGLRVRVGRLQRHRKLLATGVQAPFDACFSEWLAQ